MHDAGMAHAHIGDQPLKTFAPGCRRARLALIVVDDDDLIVSANPVRRRADASAYCRFVLSMFSMTCRIEDWRTYRYALRSRW